MKILGILFIICIAINVIYIAACVAVYLADEHMENLYEGKEGEGHDRKDKELD